MYQLASACNRAGDPSYVPPAVAEAAKDIGPSECLPSDEARFDVKAGGCSCEAGWVGGNCATCTQDAACKDFFQDDAATCKASYEYTAYTQVCAAILVFWDMQGDCNFDFLVPCERLMSVFWAKAVFAAPG